MGVDFNLCCKCGEIFPDCAGLRYIRFIYNLKKTDDFVICMYCLDEFENKRELSEEEQEDTIADYEAVIDNDIELFLIQKIKPVFQ